MSNDQKPLRLSYTSVSTYLTCGMKYKLHYIDNLRENAISSPLFFGSALDNAFSRLLLEKKKVLTEDEQLLSMVSAEEVFEKHMKGIYLNGEIIDGQTDLRARFSKGDWEDSLCKDCEYTYRVDEVFEKINKKMSINADDYNYWHQWVWTSLLRKGKLLLEEYKKQVIPLIKEVFSIQRRESLPNEAGDEFYGLIDFECEFVDEPGVRYTCDNKTASQAYKADSVKTSEQLAIYNEFTGNKKAAYIVVEKKLRVKEPKVRITIIRDTISEKALDAVFEKIDTATQGIKQQIFNCNENSCYQFGQPCPYYKLCKYGNSDNLIKLDKKDK
jgi:hypothetical protein